MIADAVRMNRTDGALGRVIALWSLQRAVTVGRMRQPFASSKPKFPMLSNFLPA
jgi:hypothetical protein